MPKVKSGERLIIEALQSKACTKQIVYRATKDGFALFNTQLRQLQVKLSEIFQKIDKDVEIAFRESGDFQSEFQFGGDILYFSMHTNIFTFDEKHPIFKKKYIKEDPLRAYFGVISIYNFLADSLKYNRMMDLGSLIARVFINRDMRFFVDGARPLHDLFHDVAKSEISETNVKIITQSAVLFALDYDLFIPPFSQVNVMSVQEKMQINASEAFRTEKKMGFRIK